jgi:hypothetical protein
MFSKWQIGDFELNFSSFLDSPSFGSDDDILVGFLFPDIVEVEFAAVLYVDCLGLLLVDEEVSIVELVWLSGLHLDSVDISKD